MSTEYITLTSVIENKTINRNGLHSDYASLARFAQRHPLFWHRLPSLSPSTNPELELPAARIQQNPPAVQRLKWLDTSEKFNKSLKDESNIPQDTSLKKLTTWRGMTPLDSPNRYSPEQIRLDALSPTPKADDTCSSVFQEEPPQSPWKHRTCSGCRNQIMQDRCLGLSDGQLWHMDCLSCIQCGRPLQEESSCFYRLGNVYCKEDYIRLFGSSRKSVSCAACRRLVYPYDLVMRSQLCVYHLECFTCSHCHRPLLPGERYAMRRGQPVCQADLMLFDSFSCPSSNSPEKDECCRLKNDVSDSVRFVLERSHVDDSQPFLTAMPRGSISPAESPRSKSSHPPHQVQPEVEPYPSAPTNESASPTIKEPPYVLYKTEASSASFDNHLRSLICSAHTPHECNDPNDLETNRSSYQEHLALRYPAVSLLLPPSSASVIFDPQYAEHTPGIYPSGPMLSISHKSDTSQNVTLTACSESMHSAMPPLVKLCQEPNAVSALATGMLLGSTSYDMSFTNFPLLLSPKTSNLLKLTETSAAFRYADVSAASSMLIRHQAQQKRNRKRRAGLHQNYESVCLNNMPGFCPGVSTRQKRMRTSFKHHQLRAMKAYFNMNHNPDVKDLRVLTEKTGLSKRVLQVWFQNARAKYRRGLLRLDATQSNNALHNAPTASSNGSASEHGSSARLQNSPSDSDSKTSSVSQLEHGSQASSAERNTSVLEDGIMTEHAKHQEPRIKQRCTTEPPINVRSHLTSPCFEQDLLLKGAIVCSSPVSTGTYSLPFTNSVSTIRYNNFETNGCQPLMDFCSLNGVHT
ncbi:unnamed protein product [Dicrocoelium dendriticum]|nr:unnamed protein product [Dicrocoelium dendriticum]